MAEETAVQPNDPKIVSKMDPGKEMSDSGTFQDMVAKLESGMNEWNESRYKQPDAPATKQPDKPQEKKPEAPPEQKPSVEPKAPPADTPAVKPEEKPATDEEEPVPAIIKSKKAADEFRTLQRNLKAQIRAKEQQILGLRAQVEQAKHAPLTPQADPKELEQLKAEREQLIEQIERANLESSPRFKGRFEKMFSEIEAMAKDAAGEQGDEAVALMKMPQSKYRKDRLNQMVAEMAPADQTALVLAFSRMDQAKAERDNALSNHREYLQQIQAEEIAKESERETLEKAKREYIIKQVLEVANDFEAFKPIEGDEEHNAEADEYRREIAAFINGEIDQTHSAFLPILAAEGQYLKTKKVPALEAKIKELETVISDIKGANPKLDGAKTKETDREVSRPKGFSEAFKELWKGPNLFQT